MKSLHVTNKISSHTQNKQTNTNNKHPERIIGTDQFTGLQKNMQILNKYTFFQASIHFPLPPWIKNLNWEVSSKEGPRYILGIIMGITH